MVNRIFIEFNPDFNHKLGEISANFKYLDVEELCAGDESEDSDQEDDDRKYGDDHEDDDLQGGQK
ncbi:hypothetical protein OROMI_004880 [Orobanche minor]